MTTLKPLAANSPRLRRGRFVATPYAEPVDRRYHALAPEARFVTLEDAKQYADETWPDAAFVFVDRYSEASGWLPHRAATRQNGEW